MADYFDFDNEKTTETELVNYADKNEAVEETVNQNDEITTKKAKVLSSIFDWLDVISTAIISVVIIFSFIFRVATIDGPSMEDTLYTGEKVVITDAGYYPSVGDVIVISRNAANDIEGEDYGSLPIIKRVIATQGQKVDIDFESGKVYVDDVEIKESYVKTPTNRKYDIEFPVTVKSGCVFVLGDNRNDSLDSRSSSIGDNGMISQKYILGKAKYRIFPFSRASIIN